MELNRSELRKKIMTILYQINICEQNKIKYDVNDLIKNILEIDNDFVKETVYGVITNRKQIDEYANKYLKNWSLDRLGNTDQAIIRLGIYELMYKDSLYSYYELKDLKPFSLYDELNQNKYYLHLIHKQIQFYYIHLHLY